MTRLQMVPFFMLLCMTMLFSHNTYAMSLTPSSSPQNPSSFGDFEFDPITPKKSVTGDTVVKIFGHVNFPIPNSPMYVTITKPDGVQQQLNFVTTSKGDFYSIILLNDPDDTVGHYKVNATYANISKLTSFDLVASDSGATNQIVINYDSAHHDSGCDLNKNCYTPQDITIFKGDTLTWVNQDSSIHIVASGDPKNGLTSSSDTSIVKGNGVFNSNILQPGQIFTYTFLQDGAYSYFDTAYPWMVGSVTVEEPVNSTTSQSSTIPGYSTSTPSQNLRCALYGCATNQNPSQNSGNSAIILKCALQGCATTPNSTTSSETTTSMHCALYGCDGPKKSTPSNMIAGNITQKQSNLHATNSTNSTSSHSKSKSSNDDTMSVVIVGVVSASVMGIVVFILKIRNTAMERAGLVTKSKKSESNTSNTVDLPQSSGQVIATDQSSDKSNSK